MIRADMKFGEKGTDTIEIKGDSRLIRAELVMLLSVFHNNKRLKNLLIEALILCRVPKLGEILKCNRTEIKDLS